MQDFQRQFIDFIIANNVLRFGEFTLKSGRVSPYFFNSGLFNTGGAIAALGRFYAQTIIHADVPFDMLFGPAYKGIPLATATAIALADHQQRDVPYAFNRKEAKDHAEGGIIVGAPLAGRVLIIDDVVSAGISARQSIEWIEGAGAQAAGIVIAVDRQERGQGSLSAVQEIRQHHHIPVTPIITLDHIERYLQAQPGNEALVARIQAYRAQYGAAALADD